MTPFPFHEFALEMATTLSAIAHSAAHPRFFTASGPEDTSNVDDRLSSVDGTIMVAVDGCEMATVQTTQDQVCERTTYYILIARKTNSDRPDSIRASINACRDLALQVRNVLWCRYRQVSRDAVMYGCGPLADNFYGVALEFHVDEYPPSYAPDDSYFIHPERDDA